MTDLEAMRSSLNSVPRDGFAPDEMRKRLKVLDAFDKLVPKATKLELEDAEMETLKTCMAEMKWAVLSPDILKLTDAVKAL